MLGVKGGADAWLGVVGQFVKGPLYPLKRTFFRTDDYVCSCPDSDLKPFSLPHPGRVDIKQPAHSVVRR